jgi:hypothetical protein
MNHPQSQMLFEWLKVTVVVKQLVTFRDTECGDNTINRLANGNAPPLQQSKVLCGSYGQICPQTFED